MLVHNLQQLAICILWATSSVGIMWDRATKLGTEYGPEEWGPILTTARGSLSCIKSCILAAADRKRVSSTAKPWIVFSSALPGFGNGPHGSTSLDLSSKYCYKTLGHCHGSAPLEVTHGSKNKMSVSFWHCSLLFQHRILQGVGARENWIPVGNFSWFAWWITGSILEESGEAGGSQCNNT